MNQLLFTLIYFTIFYVVVTEISSFFVLGWFANKKLLDEIDSIDENSFLLNNYNRKIISPRNHKFYISHTGFAPSILAFYYIGNPNDKSLNARIPIWSKTHWKIRKIYSNLKQRNQS